MPAAAPKIKAMQLMAFANRVAKQYPSDLYILGGDFNAVADSALYSYLTEQINLIDTFAAVNDVVTDPGYTFAVPGNPYLYRHSPRSEPH